MSRKPAETTAEHSWLTDAGILALVVLGMVVFLLVAVPAHMAESQGGDYPYYVQIAQAPLDNTVPSPWRYRVLNPLLASLLTSAGVATDVAFLSLTALFATTSCVLMRVYLLQVGLSLFAARTGVLLFAVTAGAYIPLRRYYGYTDALTNTLILLVLVLTAARRHVATVLGLGVGTLAKESLLLMLPFLARRWHLATRSWVAVAAVLVAPAAVFLALRVIVPPDPSGSPVALTLQAQFDYWQTAMVHGPVRWGLWALAYSFGPLWLVAAIGLRGHGAFVKSMVLYVLPLLVPLTRTTDTERALMLLFPLVIPLASAAIDRCRGHTIALPVAAVSVISAWVAQLTFDWGPQRLIGPVTAKDMAFTLLCFIPVAAVLACRRRSTIMPSLRWTNGRSRD